MLTHGEIPAAVALTQPPPPYVSVCVCTLWLFKHLDCVVPCVGDTKGGSPASRPRPSMGRFRKKTADSLWNAPGHMRLTGL